MPFQRLLIVTLSIFAISCTAAHSISLWHKYGESKTRQRIVDNPSKQQVDYWADIKPILDSRCVVCHGCYDAPCQLKLSAPEGIDRGGSKDKVYNATRLLEAQTTRLFVDAQTTKQWREKDFYPVLNEYEQTQEANKEASLIYRMLELKQEHPQPEAAILGDEFEFDINRDLQCPRISEFEGYADNHPKWGMPYALPGLNQQEHNTLVSWLEQGAKHSARPALSKQVQQEIAKWEAFLNGESSKHQLSARYIYEHLFLGNLYFEGVKPQQYFKLVRSRTPPGQPVDIIATRRPFDDPQIPRVYYRLTEVKETILSKTHIPYALNSDRLKFWQKIFIDEKYTVKKLPEYKLKTSANPFETFIDLPVHSRYAFMLDDARFTIMGFIKGPVCRGQVALNVINDHFWVFFTAPNKAYDKAFEAFYRKNYELLELPASKGTILEPVGAWLSFSEKQKKYREKKAEFLKKQVDQGFDYDLSVVWDGDKSNKNAALTVFRHFDSATVERGLQGSTPKTAWLLSYTDLERIHYLLTAGYDVYGNVGHQLLSRLYMDFLRMDSEANFLLLLPKDSRKAERDYWYRKADAKLKKHLTLPAFEQAEKPDIQYTTRNHKQELLEKIEAHLGDAVSKNRNISSPKAQKHAELLAEINQMRGKNLRLQPEHAILMVKTSSGSEYYSILRNSAHYSITSLFQEQKYRAPQEDTMLVLNGFVGSYPGAFYQIKESEIQDFVKKLKRVDNEAEFNTLRDQYGVRRTDPSFWKFSDQLNHGYKKLEPLNFGRLDYNRLENR